MTARIIHVLDWSGKFLGVWRPEWTLTFDGMPEPGHEVPAVDYRRFRPKMPPVRGDTRLFNVKLVNCGPADTVMAMRRWLQEEIGGSPHAARRLVEELVGRDALPSDAPTDIAGALHHLEAAGRFRTAHRAAKTCAVLMSCAAHVALCMATANRRLLNALNVVNRATLHLGREARATDPESVRLVRAHLAEVTKNGASCGYEQLWAKGVLRQDIIEALRLNLIVACFDER
ncbi:MAG: hypothetical protein ACTHU0_21785 [Kofleriaceae bacterium]